MRGWTFISVLVIFLFATSVYGLDYCSDTDGGQNIYVRGAAVLNDSVLTDYCFNSTTINEYYCIGDANASAVLNCPQGFSCSEGACSSPTLYCIDNEIAADFYVRGTLNYSGIIFSDTCYESVVSDVYCVNATSMSSRNYTCTYGCSNGACLSQPACPGSIDVASPKTTYYASENGEIMIAVRDGNGNPMPNFAFYVNLTKDGVSQGTQSYTTNSTGWYYSSGAVSSTLKETYYYTAYTSVSNCTQRSDTLFLTFMPSQNCTDTDGGLDYYVSGAAQRGTGTSYDYCTSSTRLQEFYCSGNEVVSTSFECPYGCENKDTTKRLYGACINKTQNCTNKCGDGVCNEFVCVGSECPCVETSVTCPKDCGIQETCTDTDGGKDLLKRGVVSYWRPGYSQTFNDWCFSDYRYIMEYWCGKDVSPTGKGMTSMSFACPEGYLCRDGACMQSTIPYGCPSSVYIAFDRNEYRFGDTVYVKVGVWDVNSRGLPNARVWVEGKYNGVPIGLSELKMDEYGNYYSNSTVGTMQQGVYEYTVTYNESGCPSISAGTKMMVYNMTAQKCKDSDGGIDYYTKGMASQCSDSPQSACRAFDDQCSSSNVLKEGFCKDDNLMDTEYTCPSGCRDGACLKSGNVTQVGFRNAYWQCYDGKESNEGGETSCKTSETWNQYANDFCAGRCTAATSIETKCKVGEKCATPTAKCGVNSFSVSNECDTGTAAGECKDSDGGKDAYVAGKTWMGNNVQEDACYDKSVIEYYCSYDSATNTEFIKKDEIPCPMGCSGGACINEKKDDCRANGYYCASKEVGCGEGAAARGYNCEWADEVCCFSKPPQYEEKIKVKIDMGWNLISIPGTFSVDKGTCSQPEKWAFFWWYPPEKRFIGMKDVEKLSIADWDFKKAAFWAYSPENCQMEFRISSGSEYYSADDLPQLYAGWNMVAITKDMLGSRLGDLKGSCEVKSAYVFDGMKWKSMGEQVVPASLESLGHGMAVNVASDCRLGFTSITPPAFPTGMMIAV